MNRILRFSQVMVVLAMCWVVVFTEPSNACPNCYSDPNSSMAQGMNMAVVSLLGVTGGVLVAFGSFFVFLKKRALMTNKTFSNRFN